MCRPDSLPVLLSLIRSGFGPDRELDARIEVAMRWLEAGRFGMRQEHRAAWRARADGGVDDGPAAYTSARFTGSLDAAVALIERVLPGWWWKCGTCCVSDDACMAPDFNSTKHGKRLRKEFEPLVIDSEFDAGFDVDRRPPGNAPRALLESLIRALIGIETHLRKTSDA